MNRYQIEFVDRDGQVILSRAGTLRQLSSVERRVPMHEDVAVFIRRLGADKSPLRGR